MALPNKAKLVGFSEAGLSLARAVYAYSPDA